LSVGWLLFGNQPIAPIGSLTTNAPVRTPLVKIGDHPSNEPSGSSTSTGVPE
jgi:hypothetical protein